MAAKKTEDILMELQHLRLDDFIEAVEKQLSQLVETTNFYIALYDAETGMLSAPFEKDEKDSIDTWPAKGSATGLVIEKKESVLLSKQDVFDLIERGEISQTGSICESWLGVPLFRGTDVSGVIVVQSYDNPEAFDNNTLELFEYVSNQVSMALERTRIFEDLLKAKIKAEESDRLKSAFLANMSHEIRTPMNGILGFADLLKEPHLSDEQQQKYIGIIEKSGLRMLNIINDIVDLSRIEAGLMDVTLKESNINEQLDFIYTFFKPQVEAKGMKLELSDMLPAERAAVVTDREKLFAILTNLVKNAIKYSDKGFIEFGCNITEMHGCAFLKFFVKDTGIGIPKDRQQAVFNRFVQADIEDRQARQGAGLGLAISKAYVEMLGGEIWVESEAGKGSTFYFTIPCESPKAVFQNDENTSIPESNDFSAEKLKILIVEDDDMSAMLLKEYVKPVAKEIVQAFTGEEAVDICKQKPDIDFVLMDIKLPVMDGKTAAREIRRFNKDVVIIAQTAKALMGDEQIMLNAGFNHYIAKPIIKEELHALINKYFGK